MKRKGVPLNERTTTVFAELENDSAKIEDSIWAVLAGLGPLLSLTLYLCAEDRELDPAPPSQPEATRTNRGDRFFAAHRRRFEIGRATARSTQPFPAASATGSPVWSFRI